MSLDRTRSLSRPIERPIMLSARRLADPCSTLHGAHHLLLVGTIPGPTPSGQMLQRRRSRCNDGAGRTITRRLADRQVVRRRPWRMPKTRGRGLPPPKPCKGHNAPAAPKPQAGRRLRATAVAPKASNASASVCGSGTGAATSAERTATVCNDSPWTRDIWLPSTVLKTHDA